MLRFQFCKNNFPGCHFKFFVVGESGTWFVHTQMLLEGEIIQKDWIEKLSVRARFGKSFIDKPLLHKSKSKAQLSRTKEQTQFEVHFSSG